MSDTAIDEKNVNIRFAGDSGDGMQLMGSLFTDSTAISGNDIFNLTDFPAEIRAPAGTIPGVSGYQLRFADHKIQTPGDNTQVLVAMNPAALKANIQNLVSGGILIYNSDSFTARDLKKAKYLENPLETAELLQYRLFGIPMTELTLQAVKNLELTQSAAKKCKNMLALGIIIWLFSKPVKPIEKWIADKFVKQPLSAEANTLALQAGYSYAEVSELFTEQYTVAHANLTHGHYRKVTGNQALALGCVAAAQLANLPLLFSGYPITPASTVLHDLSQYKNYNVKTFQAEDEISAMCATIGAAYGGSLAATITSGPGLDLKSEALGLAIMTELPMVIIVVQRAGPATGMPTKNEQTDLLAALYGRHGESPLPVLAANKPHDCFYSVLEAFRVAIKYMTPVILLSDGYLATGADAWHLPEIKDLPDLAPIFLTKAEDFTPYQRDPISLARPWVKPGTPGLEHRIGGIEKENGSGNISYDPDNHQQMVDLRKNKIDGVLADLPLPEILGKDQGDVLVISWGSTLGAVATAVEQLQTEGAAISAMHLQYLYPLHNGIKFIAKSFKYILIPELNTGQLWKLLRMEFLLDAVPYNKVTGQPFTVTELVAAMRELLAECEKTYDKHQPLR